MRKGFTLVELLAVIIIIGLVIGLSIFAYNNLVLGSKKTAYETAEESMANAVESMQVTCLTQTGTKPAYCSKLVPNGTITLGELISSNYLEDVKDPNDRTKNCSPTLSTVKLISVGTTTMPKYQYESCLVCGSYRSAMCN